MKIADFFIQITAKGDLKELKMIADAQKAIKEQSKTAIATAKVKIQQLKKETAEVVARSKAEEREFKLQQKQSKEEAKRPKNLKQAIMYALGLKNAFVGMAASIITTAVVLDRMVIKLAQANQLYTNFQRQTGIPVGRALGVSGAMANLDVTMTPQDVMQNLQNLQSNLIGVQFGMGNIAPYQMAGINPWGINSANMLDVIRKQMKGFAPAYRTFLLQQMGLDARLGALIDLSDTEYLKYKQEALELYLSPEDRKTIQDLAPEWNKVNLKFTKGWERLTMMLSRDFVGFFKILADLWGTLVDILQVVNTVIVPFIDILNLVLRPIYYLLDDLIGFLIGKDSIIGRFLSGDKEGTKGAFGVLFGVGSKEMERFLESVTKLNDFIENSIIGKAVKFTNFILNPFSLVNDLASRLAPNNVTTNKNRNLSMNNIINVNATNQGMGIAIGQDVSHYLYGLLTAQGY